MSVAQVERSDTHPPPHITAAAAVAAHRLDIATPSHER
jgi:hypothetical protein